MRQLSIANFRGFQRLHLKPRGHVFLVGQPGAGRSDVVEALARVLAADVGRFPIVDDLDFYRRDRTRRIEIEVVLGDLGSHLEQLFLDRLEFWDVDERTLIEELGPEDQHAPESLEHVVRLSYRAEWEEDQQQGRQWVDFPKFSDPEAQQYLRVPRLLREELPFVVVRSSTSVLSLGARSELRRLVDAEPAGDFAASLDKLLQGLAGLAEDLDASSDLSTVLERIFAPLRFALNLGDRPISDIVRFAPEGASIAGVLRSLAPLVKLGDELGFIPLSRHGSTLSGMLELARAVAQAETSRPVIALDDYAEGVDPLAAQHLAAMLRKRAAQVWLSSRTGSLGQSFRPEEICRLTVSHEGQRQLHVVPVPTTRAERIAARHLHPQLLPASSARAVLITEGPHDRAALAEASAKLNEEEDLPLLAARRIAIVDAGATDSAGGITAVPRLANLARRLGFFVIALIDWDRKADEADARLGAARASADVVIRWPQGFAIERVLSEGVEDETLRTTIKELADGLEITLGFDPDAEAGDQLQGRTMKFLKSSGGLHGPFVQGLPGRNCPPLLRRALEEALEAVGKAGLVQL